MQQFRKESAARYTHITEDAECKDEGRGKIEVKPELVSQKSYAESEDDIEKKAGKEDQRGILVFCGFRAQSAKKRVEHADNCHCRISCPFKRYGGVHCEP